MAILGSFWKGFLQLKAENSWSNNLQKYSQERIELNKYLGYLLYELRVRGQDSLWLTSHKITETLYMNTCFLYVQPHILFMKCLLNFLERSNQTERAY